MQAEKLEIRSRTRTRTAVRLPLRQTPRYKQENNTISLPIPNPPSSIISSQIMQHKPAKAKEYQHTRPENPLILFRPPLNHAYRVTTHTQRVRHTIQSLLRPLQNLPLLPQIPQHSLSSDQVFIKRLMRIRKEVLLSQRMCLPCVIPRPHTQRSILRRPDTGARFDLRICVRIIRCCGIVWSSS
jgi:hypothetical protein